MILPPGLRVWRLTWFIVMRRVNSSCIVHSVDSYAIQGIERSNEQTKPFLPALAYPQYHQQVYSRLWSPAGLDGAGQSGRLYSSQGSAEPDRNRHFDKHRDSTPGAPNGRWLTTCSPL